MKIAVDARTLGSRPSGVGMYLNDFLKQLMNMRIWNSFLYQMLQRVNILSHLLKME